MFKPYREHQLQLLPPDLSDMIVKDHLARLISYAVETMDISFIESTYSPEGQRAYDPRMLLKILVYGYAIGLRGSRKLADRLKEDIVCMWLTGRQTPDFRTISDFRKDKLIDFKKVFDQVLTTCFAIGMARVGKVSLDGTKMLASASKNKAVYRTTLKKRRELIHQRVEEIMAEVEAADEEEERLYGNATPHRTGKVFTKEEIAKAVKKVERERARLEKKQNVLKTKETDIKKKERLMRKDRNSFSSTDKDATVMMMKEGYAAPGYNVQLATEKQVILGYGVYSNRFRIRLRLQSEEGKQFMKRRREDVEPVFGNLKRNMEFRRFNLRGKWKCELELGLVSLAHNLKKIKSWVRRATEWDEGTQKGQELGMVLGYLPA